MANQTVYPYGTDGSLPSSIGIIDDLTTGGANKALSAEQGKVLGNAIFGEAGEVVESFDFSEAVLYNISLDAETFYYYSSAKAYKAYCIPIPEGTKKITFDLNTSVGYNLCITKTQVPVGNHSGSTIASNYMATGCDGYAPNNGSAYRMYLTGESELEIIPSSTAKFIYLQKTYSGKDDRTPNSLVFTIIVRDSGLIPRVEELEQRTESAPTAPSSGVSLKLTSGRVDDTGLPVSDNTRVITEVIFGKFNIIMNENWRIYEGHLYDRNGNMVAYQHLHPQVTWMGSGNWPDTWTGRTFYANTNSLPDWGMRLVMCKADQSAINEGEVPVKSYVNLTDAGLKRWIPEDLPNYDRALRRIDCLASLRWVPLAKVPNGYTTSSSSSASDDVANSFFCLPGQLQVGVPYSDVAETRKYVPTNVSIRTFMTATKNKRSLLYTEELHQNVSKYGFSYTKGHRRSYYGCVCNLFTGWVMGIYTDFLASRYQANQIDGLVTVEKGYQNAKPLDLVWFSGHIAIVSAVWLDEFGNRRYIEMAEMATPYPYKILYTPEEFDYRTRNEVELHRWNGWTNLPEPDDVRDTSQYVLGDVKQEIAYNPDIMCFAGDYAAFAEGDTIHLNARRNSVYTGVELYKDDVLLQTIDISGLSADTIVTPNTEDWVDVNLTTLNLTYGKYKARLTDGTNTTDYTYFEVIDITFTATKSGSTVTAYFSSNEGTPVSLERVKKNGFPDSGLKPITAEMVEAGQTTGFNVASGGYSSMMLVVKGDYGTAIKVIPIPTS